MTHHQFTEKHKPAMPCSAYHLTFGNRCLNCGYDPEKHDKPMANKVSK